jgi:hypothetical protein
MATNYQTVYRKTRTTRNLFKRVPVTVPAGATGFASVNDGVEGIFYEISVNWDGLHEMARKAAGSKSGVSNDGPLRVKITSRRKLST